MLTTNIDPQQEFSLWECISTCFVQGNGELHLCHEKLLCLVTWQTNEKSNADGLCYLVAMSFSQFVTLYTIKFVECLLVTFSLWLTKWISESDLVIFGRLVMIEHCNYRSTLISSPIYVLQIPNRATQVFGSQTCLKLQMFSRNY